MGESFDICVVGAGAAGLFGCAFASVGHLKTALFEKNTAAGRKLLITGGGRCNLTHIHSPKDFADACEPYGRFLRHSLYECSPQRTLDLFGECGVEAVRQSDGCVFPVSQKAADVRDALVQKIKNTGTRIFYDKAVENITAQDGGFIVEYKGGSIYSKTVIITTGGLSYPKTGSTGDGYRLAQSLGHTIIQPRACLVPLVVKEKWAGRLAGVSVAECGLCVCGEKKKSEVNGSLVFTDDGIGGPAVINFSRKILPSLEAQGAVHITVDLLAGFKDKGFDAVLACLCADNPKKEISQILSAFLPRSLINAVSSIAGVDVGCKAGQFAKQSRVKLAASIQSMPLTVTAAKPVEQATVTRGGVSGEQIEPLTMQSKLCPGLFLAGEVIDADGPCGGYNLQIAFSTGLLAVNSAAAMLKA